MQTRASSAFVPRSFGVGLISSAVLIGALSEFAIRVATHQPPPQAMVKGLLLAILLTVDAAAIFFAAIFVTMRYFVTESHVILRCGPFRWKIPLRDIRSIVERDVGWMPVSEGWKLPGYALFTIHCADIGAVRMCSTALTKRILLIDTCNHLWGITPRDVEGFVAALNMKLGN
jgi:Bacterial PH domain